MTRLIHDQFAKDYLEELLSPFGTVQLSRPILAEVREIDVWFSPAPESVPDPALGLLTRFMTTPGIFEIYHNPVTEDQIGDCLSKVLEAKREVIRQANRERVPLDLGQLPRLWILTPTASEVLLETYGADEDPEWPEGIFPLARALRAAVVVIHQLPRIREPLWLRVLGRGRVQQQAIEELEALPEEDEWRAVVLELLLTLQANLVSDQDVDPEDRELIMKMSPLFTQQLQSATQTGIRQGIEQGIRQGIEQERRRTIESSLRLRFGSLDQELSLRIPALIAMDPDEYMALIWQSSREDLLAQVPVVDPERSNG